MDDVIKNEILHDYLCKNGHKKVARKLTKVQNFSPPNRLIFAIVSQCLMNRGHKSVAEKVARWKSFSNMNLLGDLYREISKPDPVIYTLVVEYLEKFGYETVAMELESVSGCKRIDVRGLDLVSICDSEIPKVIRSLRRPKKKVADQTADIIQRLSEVGPDDSKLPLKIVIFPGKNRGIVPTKKLTK